MSHRHAQLTLDGDHWSVEDLGSTNGTFVGGPDGTFPGDPLPVDQRHELAPDERVYVGAWTTGRRPAGDRGREVGVGHPVTHPSRSEERRYEHLSPFELKSRLLSIASAPLAPVGPLLDAGRGNPNWVATRPGEAFFLLGTFALGECRRTAAAVGVPGGGAGAAAVGIGGTAAVDRIADRLRQFLASNADVPGADLLGAVVDLGIGEGFEPDAWVHELTSGSSAISTRRRTG